MSFFGRQYFCLRGGKGFAIERGSSQPNYTYPMIPISPSKNAKICIYPHEIKFQNNFERNFVWPKAKQISSLLRNNTTYKYVREL